MRIFVLAVLCFALPIGVLSDQSASFCLCTLKHILEEFTFLTTPNVPPRYRPLYERDIGFFIRSFTNWIPVNNATWSQLAAMINAPSGMYKYISIDGDRAVNHGAALDGRRSAYLGDVIASYRLMADTVRRYHEQIIRGRTELCQRELNTLE